MSKKKPAFDVRIFERAANRLRDLRAREGAALDLLADALDAAAEHIREERESAVDREAFVKSEQEKYGCVCIFCKDTGVADDGWCEGQPCHCAMGIAREEAEKAGVVSADQRLAKLEAAWK